MVMPTVPHSDKLVEIRQSELTQLRAELERVRKLYDAAMRASKNEHGRNIGLQKERDAAHTAGWYSGRSDAERVCTDRAAAYVRNNKFDTPECTEARTCLAEIGKLLPPTPAGARGKDGTDA